MKNIRKIVIGVIIVFVVLIAGISALRLNDTGSVVMNNYPSRMSDEMALESPMISSQKSVSLGDSAGFGGTSSADSDTVSQSAVNESDKKIIKNGNMTLKVDRADDAAQKISDIAKSNGGEVFSSNFYQSSSKVKNGNMTVKVPVNNFEKAFDEIKEVASLVVRESTSGQDVTEQYTDLQSRLRNKQAEEQSIAKILEQSGKITDVLEVTRELSRVRGEIEVLQGRIRLLDSQTDMATISISISEDPDVTVIDSWRPFQDAKDALNDLIKKIQQFISFIIVLIIRIIPILLIYLAVLGILYKIGKKIYDKIRSKTKPQ